MHKGNNYNIYIYSKTELKDIKEESRRHILWRHLVALKAIWNNLHYQYDNIYYIRHHGSRSKHRSFPYKVQKNNIHIFFHLLTNPKLIAKKSFLSVSNFLENILKYLWINFTILKYIFYKLWKDENRKSISLSKNICIRSLLLYRILDMFNV